MLPASAVPVKVGVVTLVMLSVLEAPESEAAIRSGVDGLAGALNHLLEAPEVLTRMGAAGQERIRGYSYEQATTGLLQALDWLVTVQTRSFLPQSFGTRTEKTYCWRRG